MIEAIGLPAGFEVAYGIAGDSGVDDVKVESRVFTQKEIGNEVDIAEAERPIRSEDSIGIGDTVANKNNRVIFSQLNLVKHRKEFYH